MANVLLDVIDVDLDLLDPLGVIDHLISHFLRNLIEVLLEGADTGLPAVVMNDVVFHLIGNHEGDLTVQDSRILYGLRQEVPVQDVTLLVVRVTSDVDDLHPVKQGRMQVVQTIRRAEEKYLRQVDGHIQKVIGEIVILLGIQDFK